MWLDGRRVPAMPGDSNPDIDFIPAPFFLDEDEILVFRAVKTDYSYEPPADDDARDAIRAVAETCPLAWTARLIAEEVQEAHGFAVSEGAVRGVLVHGL